MIRLWLGDWVQLDLYRPMLKGDRNYIVTSAEQAQLNQDDLGSVRCKVPYWKPWIRVDDCARKSRKRRNRCQRQPVLWRGAPIDVGNRYIIWYNHHCYIYPSSAHLTMVSLLGCKYTHTTKFSNTVQGFRNPSRRWLSSCFPRTQTKEETQIHHIRHQRGQDGDCRHKTVRKYRLRRIYKRSPRKWMQMGRLWCWVWERGGETQQTDLYFLVWVIN